MFRLYLPMGVTEVYNGNHSANSGILKGEGNLSFNVTDNSNDFRW